MFNPTRDQVRNFFIESWRKHRSGEVLTAMETIAAEIVALHPEYHALVEDPDSVERDFPPEAGQINPFLHLSLHLAIEEQLSIDQPPGIRAAFEAACARRGDRHEAMHDALECLGEMLYESQRKGTLPDAAAYLAGLRRRAGGGH
jgi:hypothetical protein